MRLSLFLRKADTPFVSQLSPNNDHTSSTNSQNGFNYSMLYLYQPESMSLVEPSVKPTGVSYYVLHSLYAVSVIFVFFGIIPPRMSIKSFVIISGGSVAHNSII